MVVTMMFKEPRMDENPIKLGEKIMFKCSTQQTICIIEKFEKILNSSTLEEIGDRRELKNRDVADVIIKTERPVALEEFNIINELGRFVLERLNTCAGGIVTGIVR